MKKWLFLLCLPLTTHAQKFTNEEIARWTKQAGRVTIIRDNWGIPHIYGKSDADAVFGLLYAQCEDDFRRVEMNYIEKLGRMAEIKGKGDLDNDLLVRLVIDSTDAIRDLKQSPDWLKKLMTAFADGINYYIYKHPGTAPLLLKRFQPWFPLLWTDGSIGAINTAGVGAEEIAGFYTGKQPIAFQQNAEPDPTGSNGFAFSPDITESRHAILYINPHVTFYFRPEVHMNSEEGLNVYGAVTWGQFFVYQGFNEYCGWMHTSSSVDIADLYIEKITRKGKGLFYQYDQKELPVTHKKITIRYRESGKIQSTAIDALYTGHGPLIARRKDELLSLKANNRSLKGLIQSWERTKARGFEEYKQTMDLLANTSNNTVFADKEGNIAYWHGNFIPKRDVHYDWSKPVDGTTSATDWKGLHTVDQGVHLYNPSNGWLQNCNSTPYTVAGTNSPKKENYPAYMAPDGENFRGINAVRVLGSEKSYTLDKVIAAGYDRRLSAFELLVPKLLLCYDSLKTDDSLRNRLQDAIAILKNWDYRCGDSSIGTTLAVEWGQKLMPALMKRTDTSAYENLDIVKRTQRFIAIARATEFLEPLATAMAELQQKYGKWQQPWGDINRFQRVSGDINQQYDDAQNSLPVPFTSSLWGMLPSYSSRSFPGTKKRYGVNGNSFICAVEFGDRVRAKSLLAGGESGDPSSTHFTDQALMYTKGQFKDILFYKDDVVKHAEKTYHPGE